MPTDPDLASYMLYCADFAKDVLPRYVESARNYAHLAAGALAVSVAFREKVLGQGGEGKPTALLLVSWLCLLVAIGAAAWYEYVAVKLIDLYLQGVARNRDPYGLEYEFPLSVEWLWPGYAYGMMVASFFAGALFFVLAAIEQVARHYAGLSVRPRKPRRGPERLFVRQMRRRSSQ